MKHTLETYVDGEVINTTTGTALQLYLYVQRTISGPARYRIDGKGHKMNRKTAIDKLQAIKSIENHAALERDIKAGVI